MLTYTIHLADREADKLRFTDQEAAEMAALGFRFAEFRPETGVYRLSHAYRTLQHLERGTLTFEQAPEAPRKKPAPAPADGAAFEPGPASARR